MHWLDWLYIFSITCNDCEASKCNVSIYRRFHLRDWGLHGRHLSCFRWNVWPWVKWMETNCTTSWAATSCWGYSNEWVRILLWWIKFCLDFFKISVKHHAESHFLHWHHCISNRSQTPIKISAKRKTGPVFIIMLIICDRAFPRKFLTAILFLRKLLRAIYFHGIC